MGEPINAEKVGEQFGKNIRGIISLFLSNKDAQTAPLDEKQKYNELKKLTTQLKDIEGDEFFAFENEGAITSKDNTQGETEEIAKLVRKTWSFGEVHKIGETEAAKTIKNAFFANSIIKDKSQRVIKPTKSLDVIELQKQIKCIECSIKN
jgi:hypothetical protein